MERRLTTIKAITKFVFFEDNPQEADLIIVPGTRFKQLPEKACDLYKKGFASKILFAGGLNPKSGQIESKHAKGIALRMGVSKEDIVCENKSKNTKENAINSKKLVEKLKLKHKRVLLISKTYHARRLLMTFKKFFPESKFFVIPVEDKRKINKRNWWKSKKKARQVMEEVEKIGKYFLKEDLSIK